MKIVITSEVTADVQSRTNPEVWYRVDIEEWTCQCKGYEIRKRCAHLDEVYMEIDLFRSADEKKLDDDLIERVPDICTAQYFAEDLLSTGKLVTVGTSMYRPLMDFSYEIEAICKQIMPDPSMVGEWGHYSPSYWKKLERVGPARIANKLIKISEDHGNRPLALLCYEQIELGMQCHRLIFSFWWEEKTGRMVPEISNEGEMLKRELFPKQVMPILPKGDF